KKKGGFLGKLKSFTQKLVKFALKILKPITPLYKLAQKGLNLLGKILPKDLRDFLVEKKKFIGQPPEKDLDTDSLDKVGARQSVQLKATFTAIARREQALEQLITARNGTLAKARE